MSEFKQYRRKQIAELRRWQPGDGMTGISVSAEDTKAGSPNKDSLTDSERVSSALTIVRAEIETFAVTDADGGGHG